MAVHEWVIVATDFLLVAIIWTYAEAGLGWMNYSQALHASCARNHLQRGGTCNAPVCGPPGRSTIARAWVGAKRHLGWPRWRSSIRDTGRPSQHCRRATVLHPEQLPEQKRGGSCGRRPTRQGAWRGPERRL